MQLSDLTIRAARDDDAETRALNDLSNTMEIHFIET